MEAAVLPPSTVTVTKDAPAAEDVALPPGKVPFESPDPRDPQFVENIRAKGWSVADDRVVATWAHRVCGNLQDGATPSAAVEHLLSEAGLSVPYPQKEIDKARQFVATVISTYPQCY